MIEHPTTIVDDADIYHPECALILVGRPGSGKRTVLSLAADMGLDTFDLNQYYTYAIQSEPFNVTVSENTILNTLSLDITQSPGGYNYTDSGIAGCCVGPVHTESLLTRLRKAFNRTLVVKLNCPDPERVERYVDTHTTETPSGSEHTRKRIEQANKVLAQEPYPTHDCQLSTKDSVNTTELRARIARLVAAMADVSAHHLAPAITHE